MIDRLLRCCGAVLLAAAAHAQPTPCEVAPAGYDGPCYYGALPAFFDDFAYTSARTTGSVVEAQPGDLFAENAWHTRDGVEQTRAWYRFNHADLPIPGTIVFDQPSVLTLRLPAGFRAEDYVRDLAIHTGFTAREGTYHWRVRLSALERGQQVRQAVWAMSPTRYLFERHASGDTTRFEYWSELDFENENHFQGTWRGSQFYPDYVTRMSVGNHYGRLNRSSGTRRLSREGEAPWDVPGAPPSGASGVLVRDGPDPRPAAAAAPHARSWANRWFHLVLEVNGEAQVTAFRMIPEGTDESLRATTRRHVQVAERYYPADSMHISLSLHWIDPTGRLREPLALEVDWAYHTPEIGLTVEDVVEQVALLRRHGVSRANTTGRLIAQTYRRGSPLPIWLDGPQVARCNEPARWTVGVNRPGEYVLAYRYRVLGADGTAGSWQEAYTRTISFTPVASQSGLEIEVMAQDLWTPHGVRRGSRNWLYPRPENDAGQLQRRILFTCGP